MHFLATGQVASELKLQGLQSAEDLKNLKIDQTFFRNNWLVGFGWDEKKWNPSIQPTLQLLDQIFPDFPVFFSRVDGHASVINTQALQQLIDLKFPINNYIEKKLASVGENKKFNGLLIEEAHIKALSLLPAHSDQQIEIFLKKINTAISSRRIYSCAGFVDELSSMGVTKKINFAKRNQYLL